MKHVSFSTSRTIVPHAIAVGCAFAACAGRDGPTTELRDTSQQSTDSSEATPVDAPQTDADASAADASAPIDARPAPIYAGHLATTPGFGLATLTIAGAARTVETYVPVQRAPSPALIIAFHGTSGGSHDLFDATELVELADQHGFVVASPLARMRGENDGDWDNHSGNDRYWETFPNTDPDANADLVLVRAIIADAQTSLGVDSQRVYVLGYSNGGFFALTAAVALSDEIAAFAEAASGLVRCASTGDCAFRGAGASCDALATQAGWCACDGPEKPIALAAGARVPPGHLAHNTWDDTVSVYYTCALAARMRALGADVVLDVWSDSGAGHAIARGFASAAWTFFAAHPLP